MLVPSSNGRIGELAHGWPVRPVRVGIINIMPRVESYEPALLRPLARAAPPVEVVWIRLATHRHGSSDSAHIERAYLTFELATARGPLDGVILTGAPVEELEYSEVHYWRELCDILTRCRSEVTSVLGICWGGMALAKQLGLEKQRFEQKLFGVFENEVLETDHPILGGSDDVFRCTHSRHSGIRDTELEAARDAKVLRLLSYGPDTGYSIFESADGRFLMHLGHPEYESARLAHEWARDSALGRTDVAPPRNFDLARPRNVWRSHCNDLFSRWLQTLARARGTVEVANVSAPKERELACASR